jgi:hypothetical protein
MQSEVWVVVSEGMNGQLDRAGVPYRTSLGAGYEVAEHLRRHHRVDLVVVDQPDLKHWDLPTVFVDRLGRQKNHEHQATISAEQPLPWALRAEMLDREQAREYLGATTELPLCVEVASSIPGFHDAAPEGHEVVLAPDESASIWMAGADHVVGVPGCNLYWEVTGAGVPASWWLPEGHNTDMALRLAQDQPLGPRRALTTEYVEAAAGLLDSLV